MSDGTNNVEPPEKVRRDPSAPPGAVCAAHPERDAHFTCPRCGDHACIFCWHPPVQRCDACLKRDPAAAASPVPWESGQGSLPARLLRTLSGAFSPARTAPSFARPEVRPAVAFMLVTALPLSLLAGIVPHTRTLMFEGALAIRLVGTPSTADILVDVVRAMAGQVILDGVQLFACLMPFMTLVRAYAGPDKALFAVRVLLYRSWLHPFAALGVYMLVALAPGQLVTGGASGGPPSWLMWIASMLQVGAPVLFMMAMAYVARLACGLGMGWSILIVSVSVVVASFAAWASNQALLYVLPALPIPPTLPVR